MEESEISRPLVKGPRVLILKKALNHSPVYELGIHRIMTKGHFNLASIVLILQKVLNHSPENGLGVYAIITKRNFILSSTLAWSRNGQKR